MSFFKSTVEQIRDLYLGLTPGLRIIAGLLTAVLMVSLLFLISSKGNVIPKSSDTLLFNGYYFTQSEQNAVLGAVANAKLTGHSWEAGRLKVPIKQENAYVEAIEKAGAIPKGAQSAYSNWLNQTNAFESRLMMQSRAEAGIADGVAQALQKQYDLENVTVIPKTDIKKQGINYNKVTSVAIIVKTSPGSQLDMRKKGGIAGAVQAAFNIDDISLIKITDETGSYTASEDWLINSEGAYLAKQMEAENLWESKIRGAIPPDIDGVVVKASVQLDPRKSFHGFEVLHDKEKPTTAIYDEEEGMKEEGKGGSLAHRPGYEMQLNTPLPLNRGWGWGDGEYKGSSSSAKSVMALQGREGRFEEASNVPRSISATIQIPSDYFKRIWLQANSKPGEETPVPTKEDLLALQTAKIDEMKKAVLTLIENNIPAEHLKGMDINSKVNITAYDRIEHAPPAALTTAQQFYLWFSSNWKTLGLFALIFTALTLLWVVTRPAKPEPIIIYEAAEMPHVEPPRKQKDAYEDEEEEVEFNRTLEPFNKSMRSLQEEVSDLVAENPDAAASVLRQWIGKVAVQEH